MNFILANMNCYAPGWAFIIINMFTIFNLKDFYLVWQYSVYLGTDENDVMQQDGNPNFSSRKYWQLHIVEQNLISIC